MEAWIIGIDVSMLVIVLFCIGKSIYHALQARKYVKKLGQQLDELSRFVEDML